MLDSHGVDMAVTVRFFMREIPTCANVARMVASMCLLVIQPHPLLLELDVGVTGGQVSLPSMGLFASSRGGLGF